MDPNYERGWQRYGFDNIEFADAHVHGADVEIPTGVAFDRGPGELQMHFGIVPPGAGTESIAMHVHRDLATGADVDEWWIIIEGEGEMTFSNGDVVALGPGDVVGTYPGTGHSFRATGEIPVRLVAVLPKWFMNGAAAHPVPAAFAPTIVVEQVDDSTWNPTVARCSRCGARWARPDDNPTASTLPIWAREHACQA